MNVLENIYSWRPIVSFCLCVLWTDTCVLWTDMCVLCISHGILLPSVSPFLITSSSSVLTVVQWQEGADVAPRSPFLLYVRKRCPKVQGELQCEYDEILWFLWRLFLSLEFRFSSITVPTHWNWARWFFFLMQVESYPEQTIWIKPWLCPE